ncbi:ATP-binding protein [Phaeodactylibacter sp.]|uniref:AAA family ATPase n=1 Tax=Phaeodactylibacter sp. TaxID=1940289 RepID=UPI0025D4C70A|nr:ATP-binding protein [Phaeodactylibacter sp.]MCI4651702.1 ATP-binding protein [Phaeodactylibacter sp.]MCI5090842.1 ATP-binding protein [Phaeodactylibacter sp.]
MATADQIKSLIKSHYSEDKERFPTIALQLAASEARKGHSSLAHEIKTLIEKGRKSSSHLKVIPHNPDLSGLVQPFEADKKLVQLIASPELKQRIDRIIREYLQRGKLSKFGFSHRRKILLTGPPGTGKTMTASILSKELKIPFYVILVDKIVTKYMGETSAKLRLIFDFISKNTGVYLFDEFDAIGAERTRDNEVGEMRRVLNAFLQFLEQDQSNSFIISATNNIELLDQALFRRFDDVLFYQLPGKDEVINLVKNKLANFKTGFDISSLPFDKFNGLSHAEISQACDDAIKETILNDKTKVTKALLLEMISNRKGVYFSDRS